MNKYETVKNACYVVRTLEIAGEVVLKNTTGYLITMKNSERTSRCIAHLLQQKPCNIVHIIVNAGFRHCDKPGVQNTGQDLWHANQFIFHRSQTDSNFTLVLEDDVEFAPAFTRKGSGIIKFLTDTQSADAYSLGGQAWFTRPTLQQHIRCYSLSDSHAVIYTVKGRERMLQREIYYCHDVEIFPTLEIYLSRVPLAYQNKTQTENSKLWNIFGISLTYFRLFGSCEQFYVWHHHLAAFGGILLIYFLCLLPILFLFYCFLKRI